MVEKVFGRDFDSSGGALTLGAYEVSEHGEEGQSTRTHEDGWTISGVVSEDYFTWVNDFEANHPVFGRVWGNFEDKVWADTEEGYQHFWLHHQPEEWDYWDI
jgi:hypothetical protein